MAQVPTNEKLWTLVVTQAKLKYHPYPSAGASAWVHKRYEQLGGKFEDSTEVTKRKKLKEDFAKKLREKVANHNQKDKK